jgi:hypothetical protein
MYSIKPHQNILKQRNNDYKKIAQEINVCIYIYVHIYIIYDPL